MEAIRIVGPARIQGTARLVGAKNAALPILVAAFAADGPVTLENVPTGLKDIRVLMEIFRELGGVIEEPEPHTLRITKTDLDSHEVSPELAGRIRSSLLMLGLLTGRKGRVRLGVPGGCEIGERKFDLHLMGLEALGARTRVGKDTIEVEADKLVGTEIRLPLATTSGTENLMIAACFAEGTTRILNAHLRPEVEDLAHMLNAIGADVKVTSRKVEVTGGRLLKGGTYRVMPAWDEGFTVMCAAIMTGGEVCIDTMGRRCLSRYDIGEHVEVLRKAGAEVLDWEECLFLKGPERPKPIHVVTGPHPCITTDLHPIYAAMASTAEGESSFTDTRWPERFKYVEEFRKLGVEINHYGDCSVVRGGRPIHGANVVSTDLRCGAALAILALAAEGETVITNVYQIDRGYYRLEETLRNLGVEAERIEVPGEGPSE